MVLSPGATENTPILSLTYKSYLAKIKPGLIVSGWETPLSYIQTNINGTFSLFLNGAKHDFVLAGGRYHTNIETYLKIEKKSGAANETGEYWTVIDTNGTEYRFGATLDAENMLNTSDPAKAPFVWRWSLDQVKNANGNCIYYSYTEDRGSVYPFRIEYNNDRQRVIEFVLEDRPDPYQTVDQVSEITVAKRLSRINISVSNSLVKSFKLDYAPITPEMPQSLLTSITKLGSDGTALAPTTFTYKAYTEGTEQTWLLEKITEDLGGTTMVNYTPSAADPTIQLPSNYWLVSSIVRDNGLPTDNPQHTIATTGFTYAQGLYDVASDEFRGFGQVTETRPDGAKVIHTYHQDDALKGKEAQTVVTDAAGNPYAKSVNTWSSSSANGVYTVTLDRAESFTYDGKAENPKQVMTKYQYDAYGNVTHEARYGDISVYGDELFSFKEYVYNIDQWIVDKIAHTYSSESIGGPILRESWFNYDGHDDLNTPPTVGNLTREEHFLNTGENPVTTYDYDSYGNRTTTTDPEKRVTTIKYDDRYHTFPVEVTNAKGQTVVREFNPANGQPTLVKDPNGYLTTYQYDTFNRLVKEIKPGDSETYPSTEMSYFLDGTAPESVKVAKRETSGAGNTLDAWQFVDGFGRLIQTKTEYKNTANLITLDSFFDAMGRGYKHSNPYLTGSAADYSLPLNVAATVSQYDTLGRPIKTTNPDNTFTTTVYDHWTTTTTDENGHTKLRVADANSNLRQVVESNHVGVSNGTLTSIDESYTTNYLYNAIGEMLQTQDHYGNIVEYLYDTLGRKVTAIDPDQGRKNFVYDRAGNLSQKTDARGVTTKYTYDPLNRSLQVIYPKDKGAEYTYDRETVGTLSQVVDSLGTVAYKYDNRLRNIREDRTMDGKVWTTQWSYDALDRVVSQIYPDGKAVGFTYNTMGRLSSIPTILNSIDYNERGQEVQRNYVNNRSTGFDYNSDNQRLTKIATAGIQDFSYGYDNVGNVRTVANASDAANTHTETFTYDDLQRLVNAEDPGTDGYKSTYQYNAIGNMLAETNVRNGATSVAQYTYGLGGAGPHAVTGKADTKPTTGVFSLNNGKAYCTLQQVTLNSIAMGYPTEYIASEKADFSDAAWQPYVIAPIFTLSSGYGKKTVYFKVRNANGETTVKNGDIELLLDSNGDGTPDIYETDWDKDGLPDVWEIAQGIDQSVSGHANLDPDNDGLTNLQEYFYGTNSNKADSDDDGWSDYDEIFVFGTNPHSPMIDNVRDGGSENYFVQLGRFNQGGGTRTSSLYATTDTLGTDISVNSLLDSDGDGISDVIDPDADGNGIPDAWERANNIDLTVPGHAQLDPDHDGLTNSQEYLLGTNPNNPDSNSNGWSDYEEIFVNHTNPTSTGIDNVHNGVSENYAVRNANFNSGAGDRSGDSSAINDTLGNQFGYVVLQNGALMSVAPAMVEFGSIESGAPLAHVTVTNNGSGSVVLGGITLAGATPLEFGYINDSCSQQALGASGTCSFDVQFKPAFGGAKGANLFLQTDDPVHPNLTVNLSGIAGATIIDANPPSGSIAFKGNATLTTSQSVLLTLAANDPSGVSQMCISNTNICSEWEKFASEKSWTLPVGDGGQSVYAWFRDNVGNSSSTPSIALIVLDTVSPQVRALTPGGFYDTPQLITLSSNEPANIYYASNGMNPTTSSPIYSGPILLNFNTPLKFFAVDTAGNQGEAKTEVYTIDNQPPDGSVIINGGQDITNNPVVSLNLSATNPSAVAWMCISNTDVCSAWEPYSSNKEWTLAVGDGLKTVYSWFRDTLDYTSKTPASSVITLDQTKPALVVSTLSDGSYTNNTTLNVAGTVNDVGGIKSLTINGIVIPTTADGCFSCPLQLLTGANTIVVMANDDVGNNSLDTRIIYFKSGASVITAISPANDNSFTNQSTLTISGTVNETFTVAITLNCTDITNITRNGSNFTADVTLDIGQNTINLSTIDEFGNVSQALKRTITYDLLSPSVSINSPAQDISTNSSSYLIKGEIADAFTSAITITMIADGQIYTPAVIDGKFEQLLNFSTDKTYQISVVATDAAGNSSPAVLRNIIYDTKPPAFTVTTSNLITAAGNFTLAGSKESGVTVTATCATAATVKVNEPDPSSWSVELIGIAEGANPISLSATSTAGNKTDLSATIIRDNTLPTVDTFTLPQLSGVLTVPVSALTASDANGIAAYLVSESAITPPENAGEWSLTAPTSYPFNSSGAKTLYAWVKDKAGNISAAKSATTTIDVTAPEVVINSAPAALVKVADAAFSFSAIDLTATFECKLDTTAFTACSSPKTYNLLADGLHSFTVRAKDLAGNISSSKTSNWTIDTIKPALTVSTLNGHTTNVAALTISGTASDNSTLVNVTINGTVTPVTNGAFSQPMLLVAGSNTLTIVATDSAGNQTTNTRTVTLDQAAPNVTFTTPADNSSTASAQTTVAGSCGDASSVTVKVNSGSEQVAAISSGNYTLAVNLTQGQNTITVTATDAVNNSSSAVRTVTYDAIAPTVTITIPDQDSTVRTANYQLQGSVSDALGTVTVSVTINGQPATATLDIGNFTVPITFITESVYQVIITATDAAGNFASATRNLTYDAYPIGDADGDGATTVVDALLTLKMAVGQTTPNLTICDVAPLVNGVPQPDGKVNVADALVILRKAVGLVNW